MTQRYTIGPDIDLDVEVVLDRAGRRITESRAQEMAEETILMHERGQLRAADGDGDGRPDQADAR